MYVHVDKSIINRHNYDVMPGSHMYYDVHNGRSEETNILDKKIINGLTSVDELCLGRDFTSLFVVWSTIFFGIAPIFVGLKILRLMLDFKIYIY